MTPAEECYSELNDTSEANIARIASFIRAAVEEEREACAAKIIEVSQAIAEKMRPHVEADKLRYALDHIFVATALYVKGKIDLDFIRARHGAGEG